MIGTELNRTAELTTDGVETEFDFDLLIHADTELEVFYQATGETYSQLVLDTNYTVVFTESSGVVTTIGDDSPYAAGKILIIRHVAITQQTNWLFNDNHTGPQHENDFDRAVMRDLQIQEQLDRCVGFAIHSSTSGIEFPEPLSDNIIGWNAAATALENKAGVTGIVLLPAADGNFIVGDGTEWIVESGAVARASLGLTIGTDVLAWQAIGIADDYLLEVDGTPNSGEYARFTGDGLEGRTVTENRDDLGLGTGDNVRFGILTVTGNLITEASLIIKEVANRANYYAGYGVLWTKNTTPCQLWFTDDVGTDLRVAPQDLQTTASPQFTGQTITGNSVFGLNSSVFQPTTDSTTFFQVLDADGGTPILNVDTTNERVGVNKVNPDQLLHIFGGNIIVEETNTSANIILNRTDGKSTSLSAGNFSSAFRFDDTGTFSIQSQTAANIIAGTSGGITTIAIIETAPANSFIIKTSGNVGWGESDPETISEWTSIAPYLTLHNSTHEDTDGGRESRLNFKGEQSGGEETTLARIEVSHDGSADDQLGKEVHSVNTGAGLVEAMRLDSNLAAIFTKVKLTEIGGYAVKLTNKSGANSVAGDVVIASTGTADAVALAGANELMSIGAFLDSGIADGSEAWVVIAGIADVHMDAGGCALGDRIITSATAGRGDVSNSPATAVHFQEIGHAIETAVANANARCVIHFL